MNIEMNNVWLLLLATARPELNRLALAASFKELKMPVILFFIISNVWHVLCLFINYLALKQSMFLQKKQRDNIPIQGHVNSVLFSSRHSN